MVRHTRLGLKCSHGLVKRKDLLGLATEASGSNNWAVAPSRSATQGALIAGDPHLSPTMPGITYQMALRLGDRFCRGASLPGTLGIAFGHSNDVAWTLTNAMADVMDLFVERVEGDRYLFYAAVSRPEERLYLSWHEAGDDGEQRVRSFFVSDVCDLFGPALQAGRRTRSLGAGR